MERTLCILISVVAALVSAGCSSDDVKRGHEPQITDAGHPRDGQMVAVPDHAMPTADVPPVPTSETGMPPIVTDASPQEASVPQCVMAADCPTPKMDPAGCAVAECNAGKCVYHTQDADGDGYYANDGCRITDGSAQLLDGDDCDDGDATVNPGEWDGPAGRGPDGKKEPNRCNLKDDNCDGLGDNEKTDKASCTCAEQEHQSCWANNDGTPILYPQNQLKGTCHKGFQICDGGHWSPCYGAQAPEPETCDGLDNDCNGLVDDNAVDRQPYYCDKDKDDHIALNAKPAVTCPQNLTDCPGGIWRAFESVENLHDDCDDGNPNRFTGNKEICDDIDNDCDPEMLVDEIREGDGGLIDLKVTYYRDADGDGFGDPNMTKHVCPQQLDGYVSTPGDCDDTNKAVHPTAPETCNGIDDDCDGKIDAADPKLSAMPQMTGTTFACVGGKVGITQCPGSALDCNSDYSDGCETDGTTLANCHACNTACAFSCGATGCDEVASISAGNSHTCSVTVGGVAACWGSNEAGQLGDEHVANGSAFPIRVSGLPSPVHSIRARMNDTCAVAGAEQALFCWGQNDSKQIGSSVVRDSDVVLSPEPVESVDESAGARLSDVTEVALSGIHACAVYGGGHVACWGDNSFSQIGPQDSLGSTVDHAVAIRRGGQSPNGSEVTDAVDVVTGAAHTCLLNGSGHVECWGLNAYGETGADLSNDQPELPQVVDGVDRVVELDAGDLFTCALVDSGDVYCWGDNKSGQLGGTTGASARPVKVPGVEGVKHIALGSGFACALSESGKLNCWGSDSTSQCAVSPPVNKVTPTLIDLANIVSITAGSADACAIDSTHRALCWGSNESGKLGLGSVDSQLHPVPTAITFLH